MFERYSFVAVTTRDLERARAFWVDQLGCRVTEEKPGQFVIVDAGGLRLCLDLADGHVHAAGGSDPVIGLLVRSVDQVVAALRERGVAVVKRATHEGRGEYVEVRDPDGRAVIFTDSD